MDSRRGFSSSAGQRRAISRFCAIWSGSDRTVLASSPAASRRCRSGYRSRSGDLQRVCSIPAMLPFPNKSHLPETWSSQRSPRSLPGCGRPARDQRCACRVTSFHSLECFRVFFLQLDRFRNILTICARCRRCFSCGGCLHCGQKLSQLFDSVSLVYLES